MFYNIKNKQTASLSYNRSDSAPLLPSATTNVPVSRSMPLRPITRSASEQVLQNFSAVADKVYIYCCIVDSFYESIVTYLLFLFT